MENFNLSTANAMYDYNLDFQRPEYYDYVKNTSYRSRTGNI